ncbi:MULTISPECIES: hypothetical protein [Bradyrhizobium]|uniref:Uncharacterized protein n=2 Tax=Nitrobacteraceae TaxID=41294 RepID=A0A9X1UJQ9_9BRAD|nr:MULTISPECIES: hypothetical protein [Bradyrhizobium]MCG2631922.1 hypothetical protein [Bradyrhizobium zhengyangense]MCG2644977.1 hypothetical protein [Bradyrhizobium zhengyangense]MCG2672717.1 hypothetical protein [Bradyrhizobium zhengyangense]MDT4737928.1 hypothetical protein [Bradyrhizobium sp. WYCCWR 12699]
MLGEIDEVSEAGQAGDCLAELRRRADRQKRQQRGHGRRNARGNWVDADCVEIGRCLGDLAARGAALLVAEGWQRVTVGVDEG